MCYDFTIDMIFLVAKPKKLVALVNLQYWSQFPAFWRPFFLFLSWLCKILQYVTKTWKLWTSSDSCLQEDCKVFLKLDRNWWFVVCQNSIIRIILKVVDFFHFYYIHIKGFWGMWYAGNISYGFLQCIGNKDIICYLYSFADCLQFPSKKRKCTDSRPEIIKVPQLSTHLGNISLKIIPSL